MLFSASLFLCGSTLASEEEVPLVGRPADLPFSGASAPFAVGPDREYRVPFHLRAEASATSLEVEAPLTFTVTITSEAPVRSPPQRIDLRQVQAFTQAFHVDDDDTQEKPGKGKWRWLYRLKPRGTWVEAVPGLPFVFYNPDLRPPEKAFQVVYTDPIPLTVRPAEPPPVPLDLPESMLEVADGPGVLLHRSSWRPPGPPTLALLLGAPPVLCLAWYLLWRRRHPGAAEMAQARRSRAARRALRALDAVPAEPGRQRGDGVAAAVADYVRERFDRAPAEVTPAEVRALLLAHGCPPDLAERAGAVLEGCAACRFPPVPAEEVDLVAQARAFVLAVEALP
jgi:hypothetical protein